MKLLRILKIGLREIWNEVLGMENANGVIKKLTSAERSYYTAAEVRDLMGVSRDTAYRMIRSLRSDLIADGKLAKGYPSGKIPKKAFNKLYMID